MVDFIQPAVETSAGTGTDGGEGFRGLATIRDVIDAWAWNRGWPVAKRIGGMRVVAEGLTVYRGRPWAACRVRKAHRCAGCGSPIGAGSVAYRPLREGAGVARYDRVCPRCVGPDRDEERHEGNAHQAGDSMRT